MLGSCFFFFLGGVRSCWGLFFFSGVFGGCWLWVLGGARDGVVGVGLLGKSLIGVWGGAEGWLGGWLVEPDHNDLALLALGLRLKKTQKLPPSHW